MREREPLEAKLKKEEVLADAAAAAAVGEGLLADAEGKLLEGLVTNVFVVVEREEGEGEGGGGGEMQTASSLSRFEIQTASAEEGVLDGVMRRAVIEAAGKIGIGVRLSAPDPSKTERQRWREAFVTSALRGVAPLRGISRGGGRGGEGWSVEFEGEVPGEVTRAIAGELEAVVGHYRVPL